MILIAPNGMRQLRAGAILTRTEPARTPAAHSPADPLPRGVGRMPVRAGRGTALIVHPPAGRRHQLGHRKEPAQVLSALRRRNRA